MRKFLQYKRDIIDPGQMEQIKGKLADFERAIRYSDGRDLIVQVEFARQYARLVFDQELHDRLLREVLAADPNQPGLTLSNILAQQQARELLDEGYF